VWRETQKKHMTKQRQRRRAKSKSTKPKGNRVWTPSDTPPRGAEGGEVEVGLSVLRGSKPISRSTSTSRPAWKMRLTLNRLNLKCY
jgi:hypothetical protein